jgi:hypothetical protein
MIDSDFFNNKKFLTFFLLIILISAFVLFFFRSEIFRRENNNISDTPGGKVRLVIETEYNEYFIDQLIWVKVIVTNNSNVDYFLKSPLKRIYTRFEGTYPSGKKITESGSYDKNEMSDSLLLKPGSSFEKVMPLNIEAEKFYGEEKKETGTYKINATYQDLVSDEISITVNKPAGIDREIYEKTYEQLLGSDISQFEKIQKLGEALKKYPGTKYSPQLYKLYFDESNYSKDYNNNSEEINKFFESNYNTYGADLILEIGNVNFEKLLSKYRDSKTGYMIRQRRKEALTNK